MGSTIIQFKAKPEPSSLIDPDSGWNFDFYHAERVVRIPKRIRRSHLVQAGPRVDPYVNSNMLTGIVWRFLKEAGFSYSCRAIDLDRLPAGVTAKGEFMQVITIELKGV